MEVQSLGQEDPPEDEMATHSSILAWNISWTEEPGGLHSRGSKSVVKGTCFKPKVSELKSCLCHS